MRSFCDSYHELLDCIETKLQPLLAVGDGASAAGSLLSRQRLRARLAPSGGLHRHGAGLTTGRGSCPGTTIRRPAAIRAARAALACPAQREPTGSSMGGGALVYLGIEPHGRDRTGRPRSRA